MNSSISNSSYLRIIALLSAGGILAMMLIVLSARQQGWSLGHEFLLQYQQQKIRNAGKVDTVFVGDSALGNAIDARLWSERSGKPTLNLALTASYGNGAFYNLLRQAIAQVHPRRAIILEAITTPILGRSVARQGYLETLPPESEFIEWAFARISNIPLLFDANIVQAALKWRRSGSPSVSDHIRGDYVEQGRRDTLWPSLERARAEPIQQARAASADDQYLRDISSLCQKAHVECLFAFAPVTEVYCKNSAAYIEAMATRIRNLGLRVAPGTPLCLPDQDLGDAENHVRPSLKQAYTARYLQLLK